MNNLTKILDSIKSDADMKVAEIQKKSSLDEEKLKNEASGIIESMVKKNGEKISAERKMIFSRQDGNAEMRRREILLTARVGLLDKAYEEAEKYIINLPREIYGAFLSRLLFEALCDRVNEENILTENGEERTDGSFVIFFNKTDLEKSSEKIVSDAVGMITNEGMTAPKITVSENTVEIGGGFILKLGDVETDCSVKTLVAMNRVETEAECAKVLFR